MPSAKDVTPQKWTNIEVLFDDGSYSVISGIYNDQFCLGERWNGDKDSYGFPHQADKPIWHIVPSYFRIPILCKILDLLAEDVSQDKIRYEATLKAIKQIHNSNKKMKK